MRIVLTSAALCLCLFAHAQINFTNRTDLLFYPNVRSGAAMAIADMNGDGRDDLVRLDGAQLLRIEYQSAPNTPFSGFTHGNLLGTQWGICIADVDGNGYNDIFTGGAYNGLKLLKANASGTGYTAGSVMQTPIFLQGANFVDINNDGDIDIFACHDEGLSQAFRNLGNGDFVIDTNLINPVSTIPSDNSGNYGSVWTDYNNDGHPDLYISKCRLGVTNPLDGRRVNLMFRNNGNGTFSEVAQAIGLRPLGQSWASDFGDIDNDGFMDCFVINHDIPDKLYRNNGQGGFTDITAQSGIEFPTLNAGPGVQVKFADFDNDGWMDIIYTTLGNTHVLLRNNGDLTFSDFSAALAVAPGRIQSLALGDLNHDGYLDIIAGFANGYNSPSQQPDQLLMNNGGGNHYFKVRLNGVQSNPNGIGARLELYGNWGKQIREVRSGESYGIMNSLTQHFGLGEYLFIDSLVVRWPSGAVDRVPNPAMDQTLLLEEGSSCLPVVNFTSSNPSGLAVNFSDQSPIGATAWLWAFGDGNTSTLQNPTHTYTAPGTYSVCLTATGLCGQSQLCKNITLGCQSPQPLFTASINGLGISLTDFTAGNPTAWLWTFGDNSSSTLQNPQHTYAAPGTYTVCLNASSVCGSALFCQTYTIACSSSTVGFSATANQLLVGFSNTSSGDFNVFNWTFGDGGNGSGASPSHTYAAPGTYTVCLTASGSCGMQQICQAISVGCLPPATAFAFQFLGLNYNFQNTTAGNVTSQLWSFGDGSTSSSANPQYTYFVPGTYTVCLTTTSLCGTTQVCQTINVNCAAPAAGFEVTLNALNITLLDQSLNAPTQWLWTFGDGSSSTQQNPSHTYTAAGTYAVCLTASNNCGSTQVCLNVTANCAVPAPGFTATLNQLAASFQDNSANAPTAWLWSFGDGTTSTAQNPQHSYAAPGNYNVCLTASSVCGSNQVCQTLPVACAAPQPGFTGQASGLQLTLNNLSAGGQFTSLWAFGDGNTSTAQNPQHSYSAPGMYQVCLTVTSICGSNQACQNINVTCAPPVPNFSVQSQNLSIALADASSGGPSTWGWNFGDGSTSNLQNPSHTYATPGNYTVCLLVSSACGTNLNCQNITVGCSAPISAFASQASGLTLNFSDQSTQVPDVWAWTFGDGGSSSSQNPQHNYATPGTYTVCLTASSTCGSNQTCQTLQVTCAAPVSGFVSTQNQLTLTFLNQSSQTTTAWLWDFGDGNTANTPSPQHTYAAPGIYTVCLTASSVCGSNQTCEVVQVACLPPAVDFMSTQNQLMVTFTDQSSGATTWAWDFGDGSSSTLQNPQHTYAAPGNYTACLTASSACGNTQSCQTVQVTCAAPVAAFTSQTSNLNLSLNDQSTTGATAWAWTFGDGTASNLQNPQHNYAAPGSYTVCLTASSVCGSNQACQTVVIVCAPPMPAFNSTANGLTLTFTDLTMNMPTSWAWNFDDGTASNVQNPQHTFAAPGLYNVCLGVGSPCGSNQICQNIQVGCAAPMAAFTSQANQLQLSFMSQSSNAPTAWAWTFGDGNSSTLQNPQHSYAAPGSYTVCLTASSPCGSNQVCQTVQVTCAAPVAAFTSQANQLQISFTSQGSNAPTTWAWTFGDGNSSTLQNPQHSYAAPGSYTVCLTASSACGSNQVCQTVQVACAAPVAAFTSQANQLQLTFTSQGSNAPTTWAWTFGDGNSSTLQNPQHSYAAPGSYTVCLTASSACGSNQICQTVQVTCAAPVAAFTSQANGLQLSFTSQSSNAPTAWAWTFGDGNSSTLQNPQHSYAAPGSYTVCLTASSVCGSNQTCQTVQVTCAAPVAAFTFNASQLAVSFSGNATGGTVSTWAWTFGDGGSSALQNPQHTYALPGSYTACLTISNLCGSNTICNSLTVTCAAPQAVFVSSTDNLVATFTDQSTQSPSAWLWNFGDGVMSTLQNPVHNYAAPGQYVVCLRVTSACGSTERCEQITVVCAAPVADFTFAIDGLGVAFTNTTPQAGTAWLWTFGDGSTAVGQNASYAYAEPGTYQVCLTVVNECGENQLCQSVSVSCLAPVALFSPSGQGVFSIFFDASENNPTSWFWDFGDGNTSTLPSPVHTYDSVGVYLVCLTASNACGSDTICQNILIITDSHSTPRPQPSLAVMPNPFSTSTLLSFQEVPAGEYLLQVYHTNGQLMSQHKLLLAGQETQWHLDTATWPAGIYQVSLRVGASLLTRRLVKQ